MGWEQGTLGFVGIFLRSPTSASAVRERRTGLTSSCVQVGLGVLVKWAQQGFQGSTGFQGNQSGGEGGWAPRDRSQWASRKGTEDTPSRHVPGRTGIQFPVLLTGDKGGVLRACSSCARVQFSQALLGAGAWGQYLLAKAPAGGRGQAGRATYWKPDSSVCISANLPTAFFGLLFPCSLWDRSQPGPPRAWVPMFGSLELLLGRQG